MVHIITEKGMGYDPAENSLDRMHGVGKYDVFSGAPIANETPAKVVHLEFQASSHQIATPLFSALTSVFPLHVLNPGVSHCSVLSVALEIPVNARFGNCRAVTMKGSVLYFRSNQRN